MVITYHGLECFRISFGNLTVACNPFSRESAKQHGLKEVKFGADAAFISIKHPDFAAVEQVTYGEKSPLIISGPGEYEMGDLTARGFGIPGTYDRKERIATAYQITLENITMLFLGGLSHGKLDSSVLGALGEIDILFVPIGGDGTLDSASASALGVKLEAKMIIPMHYDAQTLAAFLKEEGSTAKAQEKLTLKKKDLLGLEGEIVVLGVG